MKNLLLLIGILFVIIFVAGCHKKKATGSSYSLSSNPHANMPPIGLTVDKSDFIADLSEENRISDSLQPASKACVLFKTSDNHSQIYYTINLNPADSVTVVQLRYGTRREKGTFIARLFPKLSNSSASAKSTPANENETLMSGMLNGKDLAGHFLGKKMMSLIQAIKHDSVFVQVDTKAHPQGEMRGLLKQNNQ